MKQTTTEIKARPIWGAYSKSQPIELELDDDDGRKSYFISKHVSARLDREKQPYALFAETDRYNSAKS